jgi:hypothetical protein
MRTAYGDESGDTGYEFASGSSPLFVVVILLPHEPEALINSVVAARRKLKKPETYEFHFKQATALVRSAFFGAIAGDQYDLYAAVLAKRQVSESIRRDGKAGLYIHALGGLALRAPARLDDVKLYLDGTGSQKNFVQALKNGVRGICREAGRREQNFGEIRILNSTHPLIQCVDMLTGVMAERAASGRSREWPQIRSHVRVEWDELK